MPVPRITMPTTGTREAHALRTHDVWIEIPEAHLSYLKWIVACKCGWVDRTLRSTSDMRDAYREHKEKMVQVSRRPGVV